ncbi:MAG TPA: elongation factor G [Flavobacteriales bacterium]|nr:elongation factor G [Flavobacteriales bacterium]
MKVYDDKHIKNVALVGASGSGKTTLADTMLFEAGLINRRGTIEAKSTTSDYHDIEKERGASVYATPLHTEWRNYKINLIDTPGLDDFVGEVLASLRVADTCIMLINGHKGVEVGTDLIWNYVDRYAKPVIFAINQLDHPSANFDLSYASIKEHYGNDAVLMQYPINLGDNFNSIIDLLKMKMYKFGPDGGKPEKLEIPRDEKEKAEKLHNELVEKAAENDEALMELYFEKGNLSEDELRQGIKIGMMKHELFPIFCLSGLKDMGSGRLMGFIDNVAPSAPEMKPQPTVDHSNLECDPAGPTVLFVFRTLFEPSLGKLTFFKVMSGELKTGMHLTNSQTGQNEHINQLFIMDGKNRNPIDKLVAGDIGATLKLKDTNTNDTLSVEGTEVRIKPIIFPEPRHSVAIFAENKNEDEKLTEALRKIQAEDPTVEVGYNTELKQQIIGCQGDLHLSVVEWTLKHVHGIDVRFESPRIAYRETIQKSGNSTYKHKKQSGGAGQFGEVTIKIEPYKEGMADPEGFNIRGVKEFDLKWGGKMVFYNCIVGGVIDQRYIPAVQKGILERMEEGPLTGSYVRDVRVILYDGKMHAVDSNDISFKIAGAQAFKEAFIQASPKLLEPIHELEILVPEELLGDVMTDLQTRRSIIMGIESKGKYQTIKARTPLAELDSYSTRLRSITQGRGSFRGEFSEFATVPGNLQEDLIKNYSKQELVNS